MPHNSGKPKRRNSILKVRPQQAEPVEVHEKGVTVECEETDIDLVHSKRVRRRVSFHSVRTVQHFDKIDNAMIHSPQKEPVADVTGSDGSRMSISTLSTPGKDKENTLILLKSGPASNSHLTSHMQLPPKQTLFDQTTRDNHDMSVSMVEHIHADTTLDALCGAMGSKVPETPIGELKDRTVDLENSAQFFGGNDDLTATLFATAKSSQFPSSNNVKLVLDETNYNDMSMDITRNVDRTRGGDNNETMMFLRGYGSAAAETGAANNTMFGCDDTIALFRNVGKKNGRKSLDVNRTQTAQIDMDITNMEKSRHVMNESQEERVDQSVVMDITQQHTSAAEGNMTLDLLSAPVVNEKEMIVDSNDTIALLSALPGTEKEYEQDSIVFEETRALLQQNSLPHRISEDFEKIQESMDKQSDGMVVNDDTLFHLKNGTFTMDAGEAEKTSADMDITNMSDVHVDRHVTITVHERRTDHGRVTDRDVVSDQHTIEHTHGTNTVVETTKIEMEEEIERNGIDERRQLKQREIGSPMVVAKKKAKIGGQRSRGEEETSIAVDTTIREDLASMSLDMGESSGVADGEINDKDKTVVTVSDDDDIMDVTETEDNNTLGGGMDSGRSKQEYLPPRKPFRRPSSIHPSTSAPRSVLDRVTVPNCPDNLSLENIMRSTTPDTLILDGKRPHDNTSMEMSMGGHADSAPRSSRSGSASRLNLTARSDISSMDTSQLTARIACLGVQNVRYLDTEEGNEEFQEKWANVLQEELLAKATISNMFREAAVVNLKEFEPKFLEAAVKANGRKCGYAVEDAIVCAKYEADKEYHEIREQIAKEALNDIETLENDMAQKAAEKRKQMDQAEELEMLEREVSDINDRLLPFEGLKADEVEQMLGAHVEPIAVLSARLNLLLEQSEMAMEIADWVINDFHKKIVPSDLDWDKRNVTIRRNRGRLMEAVNMSNVVHSPMKKMCGVRNEMREESIVLSDGDDTMHADM